MTIQDKRAKCAELRGWKKQRRMLLGPGLLNLRFYLAWCKPGLIARSVTVMPVSAYTPDLKLDQADDLWHWLEDNGWGVTFTSATYCVLMSKDKESDGYFVGEGKWWTNALVDAVSKIRGEGGDDVSTD